MKYLLPFFKKYKKESLLAPLFKMLEATFDLIVPLVVAQIINVGIQTHDAYFVITRFCILLALAVIGLLCSFTAQYFAAKAAIGTATELRHNLLAHIQTLDFAALDGIGTATLITRMTADVNQVQNGLNMFLRLFLRSPFIVFGAMVMAFAIHAQTALVFAAVILVLFCIVFGIMYMTNPLYKKQQKALDGVTTSVKENLAGVRVVRAFGGEEREQQRMESEIGRLQSIQQHVGRISALLNPLTYVVINGGIIFILWFGAKFVDGGTLLSGDVIALVNYLSQILVELLKLANLIVLLSKAVVSMGRIGDVLDMTPDMQFGNITCGSSAHEAVRFENVGLTYPQAAESALSGVSFTAKKGETIGIIGGTGSGKSTLISLIARFYDATEGTVYLEGEPIHSWQQNALRRKIYVVMQKTQLFSGTIRSNLLYGKKDATDEELWQALTLAQAADFVREKPGGLDAEVEQGGRNLSGGQKQRLSIARALVAQPDILILDDSASALDYATDAALRRALKQLPQKTTVFIISQRTASIRRADTILVLEDGQLAGIGTHDELLQNCSVYREINESTTKKAGE